MKTIKVKELELPLVAIGDVTGIITDNELEKESKKNRQPSRDPGYDYQLRR